VTENKNGVFLEIEKQGIIKINIDRYKNSCFEMTKGNFVREKKENKIQFNSLLN
jgi:hypothetical protein